MAYTSADLESIDRAISSGEFTVKTQDRMVTYRTIDELMQARAHIASALSAQLQGSSRLYPRHQLADFSDD